MRGRLVVMVSFAAVALVSFAAEAASAPAGETEKIEALIRTIEQLTDARFLRNGSEHDCKTAAEHMRRKWRHQTNEIKTARDFIRLAGSTSSQSGQPYLIRFKDGRVIKSADFLTEKLAALEAPRKGT